MPYIDIKVAGKLTKEQKVELTKQITQSIVDVTGKSAQYVYIVFEEVNRENWGIGGKLLQ